MKKRQKNERENVFFIHGPEEFKDCKFPFEYFKHEIGNDLNVIEVFEKMKQHPKLKDILV